MCQHFLCGTAFYYNTSVLFAVMMELISINLFFLLFDSCCVTTLTNCSSHSEEPVCPLSVPGIREMSLPWGFLPEMFHNCSRSKHAQTQAVRFVEKRLYYSQSATTSSCQLQVSLCLVAAEQHPVTLHLFGLLWHSWGSHGWLGWCVIVGLVIVQDLINHSQDCAALALFLQLLSPDISTQSH